MILLSGFGAAGGSNSFIAVFRVASLDPTGGASPFLADASLSLCTLPLNWNPPPPDGKWYNVKGGAYGPDMMEFEPGYLISYDDQRMLKPAQHSTIDGCLFDPSDVGARSIYWTIPVAPATGFYDCGTGVPSLPTSQLGALSGRPCSKSVSMKVIARDGTRVECPYKSSDNYPDYFNVNTTLGYDRASSVARIALSDANLSAYLEGKWYARKVSGSGIPTNFSAGTYVFQSKWTLASRQTWSRTIVAEYHSGLSNTPASSLGFSQLGSCYRAKRIVTNVNVSRIRSLRLGHTQVEYEIRSSYDMRQWTGSKVIETSGKSLKSKHVSALLILEPGRVERRAFNYAAAPTAFCRRMPERIGETIDFIPFESESRLKAMNDVQALESNWIENASGLSGTFDVVNPLLDGANAIGAGNLRLARNALASGYLAYSYAVAPNVKDFKDVKTNAKSLAALIPKQIDLLQRRHGVVNFDCTVLGLPATAYCSTTYYLRLRNQMFSKLWASLQRFGLNPSASHMWDTVPFSFVVDWFVNVGPVLEQIAAYNDSAVNYDCHIRCEGKKVQIPLNESITQDLFDTLRPLGAPLVYKWYDRSLYPDLGEVNPFNLSISSGVTKSQMAQGAALITTIFL